MSSRKLTGKWYLEKRFWGYNVMVQTISTSTCSHTFSVGPEYTSWEKARPEDLVELNIDCA